jgi:hypothetical protein
MQEPAFGMTASPCYHTGYNRNNRRSTRSTRSPYEAMRNTGPPSAMVTYPVLSHGLQG